MGEERQQISLFDTLDTPSSTLPLANDPAITNDPDHTITDPTINDGTRRDVDQPSKPVIPVEPCRSSRDTQQSKMGAQSMEYNQWEVESKEKGDEWATNRKKSKVMSVTSTDWSNNHMDHEYLVACLVETKASHNILKSYKHAIATDPDRWLIPMKVEMETLEGKHTWDLVKPPPGVRATVGSRAELAGDPKLNIFME